MKKVLVTGANGFLANYLIADLTQLGHQIYRLVRPVSNSKAQQDAYTFTDLATLRQAIASFDIVFHLAAYVPGKEKVGTDERLVSDNVNFTKILVDSYPNARFVFSSSVSVYGIPIHLPVQLNHPLQSPNAYGVSKLLGEEAVRKLPSYSIIRFTSLLGPGMPANTFVPRIILTARTTKIIRLLGDGNRLQDYMDVRDAARLCLHCATHSANSILLGVSGTSYSNRTVAEKISILTGSKIIFEGIDTSPSFSYDIEEVYSNMGFQLRYTLDDTLNDMTV